MKTSRANKGGKSPPSLWSKAAAGDQPDITVPVHLAFCGIASALRNHGRTASSNLAVLQVPASDSMDSYVSAGRLLLRQILDRRGYLEPFVRVMCQKHGDRTSDLEIYRRAAQNGKGILLCSSIEEVDEELRLFADIVMVIPPPSSRQIRATFKRFGHVLTAAEEEMVSAETWTRLVFAFQPDRNVREGLRRLRATAVPPSKGRNQVELNDGPSLDSIQGLGAAAEWGRELALDLTDYKSGAINWKDVDSGVLVSGC